MARGLKPELRDFLYRHFESGTALETLVCLARAAEGCSVEDLADQLDLTYDDTMDIVVSLYWQGFLASDGEKHWRYSPRRDDLAKHVADVLALPISRVLTEIETYAAPRTFAEAFRLRKPTKPSGGKDG
jgi:hypothetical protein